MSDPLRLAAKLNELWAARGYASTPCLYGFREAMRTKDIDAVTLGHGRIVWHLGSWPGPESDLGPIGKDHHHAHKTGRDYAASFDLFTVHCHGFDPAYPDATSTGAELAHDTAAWKLHEKFFGVLQSAVIQNTSKLEYGSRLFVRDPAERRFGELIRVQFTVRFSMREAPEVATENPTPKPQGAVIGESGLETPIVETT